MHYTVRSPGNVVNVRMNMVENDRHATMAIRKILEALPMRKFSLSGRVVERYEC